MNAPALATRPPASDPAPAGGHQHDGADGAELQSLITALEPMLLAPTPHSELHAAANLIGSIAEAASNSSLLGFQETCMLLNAQVMEIAALPDLTPAQSVLLAAWPALAREYAGHPGRSDAGEALIRHLQDPAWPTPLSAEDAGLLREWLCPGEQPDDVCEASEALAPLATAGDIADASEALAPLAIAGDFAATPEAATTPSLVSADVLNMLRAAIQDLATLTEDWASTDHPDVLRKFARRLERFRAAAEMGGLRCGQTIAAMVNDNLQRLRDDSPAVTVRELLRSWSARMLDYLQQPGDDTASAALVEVLCDARWLQPLAEASREDVLSQLRSVAAVEPERPQRQREVQPEDLSLKVPEDAPRDLLEAILHELPSHAETFTSSMQRLSGDAGSLQELDAARRVAHTLKGAANTVGVRAIAVLMHQVEDILDALRARALLPAAKLAATMVEVADCLEEMTEALSEGNDAPSQTRAVLQAVLDWANRIDQDGLPDDECRAAPEYASPAEVGAPIGAGELQPGPGAAAQVPRTIADDLTRLLSESLIANSQLRNGLQTVARYVLGLRQQNANLLQLVGDLEQQVETRDRRADGTHPNRRREDFDPLELERYDNLHTVTHRLQEAVADSHTLNSFVDQQLTDLTDLVVKADVQSKEAYEQAMRMRMVSARSVLPRLQRVVRQTCRTTGKEAQLVVEGMDTLIDSDSLKHLVDALMHILRNAVDHGIESAVARQRAGKQSAGRIALAFHREGNRILVRCQDDGAGLDFVAIRKRGVEMGLIRQDETITEQALVDLILRPGFSTRAEVTETSGRGVGLDVVLTQAARIKGSLRVLSNPGQGCLIELRLPAMLTSAHALMIPAHQELYALSSAGVPRILHPGYGRVEEYGGKLVYHFDEKSVEAVCFETLIHSPVDRSAAPPERRSALLVEADYGDKVILVPAIVDTRDVIIKTIGRHLPPVHGLVGATILGDGSVAAVLDAAELLRPAASVIDRNARARGLSIEAAPKRFALVVDDSISARRALAQCLEDSGFDVLTAKDGLEAVAILDRKRVDVLLVDLEMPRMNGLELATHVRLREDLKSLPVIMTTSRSTQKHRQQAHAAGVDIYFTKPFNEDDILNGVEELLRRSSASQDGATVSGDVAPTELLASGNEQ